MDQNWVICDQELHRSRPLFW